MKPKKPKWMCPWCEEPYGYLGRFYHWLLGELYHKCKDNK